MCIVLSSASSEFHSVGPEAAKLCEPMRTVHVRGKARFLPVVAGWALHQTFILYSRSFRTFYSFGVIECFVHWRFIEIQLGHWIIYGSSPSNQPALPNPPPLSVFRSTHGHCSNPGLQPGSHIHHCTMSLDCSFSWILHFLIPKSSLPITLHHLPPQAPLSFTHLTFHSIVKDFSRTLSPIDLCMFVLMHKQSNHPSLT